MSAKLFRTTAGLTLAVAALGLSAVPASAATDHTGPRITVKTVKTDVTLPAKGVHLIHFTERVVDHGGVAKVQFAVLNGTTLLTYPDGSPITVRMHRISGSSHDGIWEGQIALDRSMLPGSFTVSTVALDKAGNQSKVKTVGEFHARWQTSVAQFKVTPVSSGSLHKGDALTVSGRLNLASAAGWVGLPATSLDVLFLPKGKHTAVKVGTVTTDANANFSDASAFTYRGKGEWRVSYAGSANNAPDLSSGVTFN